MNYDGANKSASLGLTAPQIAQFSVNPSNSTASVLRDVMFLDGVDLLVVGTVEGNRLADHAKS